MIVVLKRWLPALLLAMIGLAVMAAMTGPVSHAEKQRPTALRIDERSLEDGDMIFRRGVGLTSDFVVSVDRASLFSHVGMICKKAGHAYVIHILPDEGRGEDDTVRMEPLARFLSPGERFRFRRLPLVGQSRSHGAACCRRGPLLLEKGGGVRLRAGWLECASALLLGTGLAGVQKGGNRSSRWPVAAGALPVLSGAICADFGFAEQQVA